MTASEVGIDGNRSIGQPLYIDNPQAFAAVTLVGRTLCARA